MSEYITITITTTTTTTTTKRALFRIHYNYNNAALQLDAISINLCRDVEISKSLDHFFG